MDSGTTSGQPGTTSGQPGTPGLTKGPSSETLLFSGPVPLTLGQAVEPKTLPISVRVSVVDFQGRDKVRPRYSPRFGKKLMRIS
jgi:hypothetical protein